MPITPFAAVNRVLGTVLAPLNAPAAAPAAQAAQTPVLFGVLAWVRRSLFNQTPTLAYNPTTTTQVDNTITGKVTAIDPDSATLTYTATTPVHGGTVLMHPDGTFTYTASPAMAQTGGTDTFTVTVSDAASGAHIHGLPGLLNAITGGLIGNAGHTATTTVNLTTSATLTAQGNDSSGAVIGALHVANPFHDTLTYSVVGGPAEGTVTINPNGTFTYTPTAQARLDAAAEGATPAELQDNFTVTVSDAHGGTATVPVRVAVDPASTPSAKTLILSDPGGRTGAVNASVTVTDPMTYLLVHDPSYGSTAPLTYSGSISDTFGALAAAPTATPTTAAITQPEDETTIGVGNRPTQVAVSPDGNRAYVTNTASKSVSVIDTKTNTVVATIGVGNRPTQVAVSPDSTRAYVTNTDSKSVSVIDTTTNTVVATIGVGNRPTQVAVSPDSTRAYVTNTLSNSVSVIDTTTNKVTATIRVGLTPTQVTVSPNGTRAYVTNTLSNSVSVIDTTTNKVTATIRVGLIPTQVTVSPDSTRAYVTNTLSNSVSVIDTTTNKVTATIRVGLTPTQVTVSPDSTRAYVTNTLSNSVSVIDTKTNKVTATISVGRRPTQVVVSPDGTRAYVTDSASNSVSVIDTTTNTVTDTIGVGNGPIALAVAPGGSLPIINPPSPPSAPDPTTSAVTGSLGVVDPDGDPLTFTVTGAPAYGTVTVDSAGTYTYVPNQAGRIRAGLGLGSEDSFTVNVTQPATTTQLAQIYVVNTNSNTVSVIGAQPAPAPATRALTAAAAPAALTAAAAPAALTEDGFSQQVTVEHIQIAPQRFDDATIASPGPYGLAITPMAPAPTSPMSTAAPSR